MPSARLAGLIGVALLVAGCGLTSHQRQAVSQFGTASQKLANVASEQFVQTRQEVIKMNTMTRRLGQETDSLEGHLTAERVKVRLAAVEALETYGELLNALVDADQRHELQSAADSFVGSLREVEGLDLSVEQANAIRSSVESIGGLVIEQMRRRAVRRVVEAAHRPVISLTERIRQSFDPEGEYWSLGYDAAVTDLARAIAVYQPGEADSSGRSLQAEAQALKEQNQDRFQQMTESIMAACDQLASAQRELRTVIHTDRIDRSDVEAFVSEVEDLVMLYRILSE